MRLLQHSPQVQPVNGLCRSQAHTKHQFGGEPFLSFDRLTLVPLQRKMIDLEARCCYCCCKLGIAFGV